MTWQHSSQRIPWSSRRQSWMTSHFTGLRKPSQARSRRTPCLNVMRRQWKSRPSYPNLRIRTRLLQMINRKISRMPSQTRPLLILCHMLRTSIVAQAYVKNHCFTSHNLLQKDHHRRHASSHWSRTSHRRCATLASHSCSPAFSSLVWSSSQSQSAATAKNKKRPKKTLLKTWGVGPKCTRCERVAELDGRSITSF